MSVIKGTYDGPILELRGKTALLRRYVSGQQAMHYHLFAQFDDTSLGKWAFGWHIFMQYHFKDITETS